MKVITVFILLIISTLCFSEESKILTTLENNNENSDSLQCVLIERTISESKICEFRISSSFQPRINWSYSPPDIGFSNKHRGTEDLFPLEYLRHLPDGSFEDYMFTK